MPRFSKQRVTSSFPVTRSPRKKVEGVLLLNSDRGASFSAAIAAASRFQSETTLTPRIVAVRTVLPDWPGNLPGDAQRTLLLHRSRAPFLLLPAAFALQSPLPCPRGLFRPWV